MCGLTVTDLSGYRSTEDPDPGYPCEDSIEFPLFLKYYIIDTRSSTSSGITKAQEWAMVENINKALSSSKIYLQRAENMDFQIEDDLYTYENTLEELFLECQSYFDKSDGIVFYLFYENGLPEYNFLGAAIIGDRYVVVRGKDENNILSVVNSVIPHEIGHALGLFHTYDYGLLTTRPGQMIWPFDPVDNSIWRLFEYGIDNCASTADRVCDTPSDPGWRPYEDYNPGNCQLEPDHLAIAEYLDTKVRKRHKDKMDDINEPSYPLSIFDKVYYTGADIHNHMSGNFNHCRNNFTFGQSVRMRCTVLESPKVGSAAMAYLPFEVESNLTYDTETRAESWIIVRSGGKLIIKSDLYMPYWGAIIVEPGGELVLDGGHIKPYADGDFWQGIEVLGTGGNTGNGKFTGTSGTIERARIAVHAENGGRVNLDNVDFINNKGGVSLKDSRHLALPSFIKNCNFTTDGVLHDLAWHVPLWDGGTLELEGTQNDYHDHTFFIRLENVNKMGLQGNDFITVLAPTADHNGIGIHLINSDLSINSGNLFRHQKVGIVKINDQNGAHGITSIKGNIFENNFRAIALDKGDLTNITGNSFLVPDIELGGDNALAIFMENSNGVSIKDLNIFAVSGVDDAEVPEESVFIYAKNSGNVRSSDIQRNDFGSEGAPWRHIELHGAHPKLQISCNPFVQSAGMEFAMGLESGASLAHQGSMESPAGNDWYHPLICTGAVELYKDSGASGYTYHSFNNDVPNCFSHGITIQPGNISKDPNYCDMPDPCPGPMIDCVLTEVDIIRDDKEDITNNPPLYLSLDQINKIVDHLDWKRDIVVQEGIYHYMETDSIDMLITLLDSMIVRDTSWTSVQALIADRYEEAPMRPGIGWTGIHLGSQAIQMSYKSTPKEVFQYTPLVMESEQDKIISDVQMIAQQVPVSLFPNPANNEIQIPAEWTSSLNSSLSGRIIDLTGRTVKQIERQNTGAAIILDVQQLSEGFFLLQLGDQSGTSFTGKFFIKR